MFIESSTHPVLTVGMQETFEQADVDAVCVPRYAATTEISHSSPERSPRPSLRASRWTGPDGSRATRPHGWLTCPRYAFQRRRYWLDDPGDPAEIQPGSAWSRPSIHC